MLEDIKVRCCFVTNLERGKAINAVKQGADSAQVSDGGLRKLVILLVHVCGLD